MNNYLGGPYFHEGVPIIPGIWGPGVPILGGSHFHMTPVLVSLGPPLRYLIKSTSESDLNGLVPRHLVRLGESPNGVLHGLIID